MDIKFQCVSCKQRLQIDAQDAGMEISCPACGTTQTTPVLISKPAEVSTAARLTPVLAAPDRPSDPVGKTANHSFRYDAFISYRHCEPDRKWAKWMHQSLETFRTPSRLVKTQGLMPRLQRVFRDEEELPASADLSQEIENALRESRFLIVVCSPRTPPSEWVNKEVQRFREMGRHDRIIALLIEGEPSESFPVSLVEIRQTITDSNGVSREQIEAVEPLAADVRQARTESARHLKRMAKLRILACILGCRFDDLRQREQERRRSRTITVTALAVILTGILVVTGLVTQKELFRQKESAATENYRNTIQFVKNKIESRLTDEAEAMLWKVPETKRGWEWGRLMRLCHQDLLTLRGAPTSRLAKTSDNGEKQGLAGTITSILFSPDGRRLITAAKDGMVKSWDLNKAKETGCLENIYPEYLTFSNNRTDLLYYSCPTLGRTRNFSWQQGTIKYEGTSLYLAARAVPLSAIQPGKQRHYPVIGTAPPRLIFWTRSTNSAASEAIMPGQADTPPIESRGAARIYDVDTGRELLVVEGHKGYVTCMYMTADGTRVATGCSDGEIKVWNIETRNEQKSFRIPDSAISAITFDPGLKHLAAGTENGTFRIWDLDSGNEQLSMNAHYKPVTSLAFSPDGRCLATGSDEHTVKFWDAEFNLCTRMFTDEHYCAISPDSRTLATIFNGPTGETEIRLRDITQFRNYYAIKGVGGGGCTLSFSPDGTLIAAGFYPRKSLDGSACSNGIELWNIKSRSRIKTISTEDQIVMSACYSPDGNKLAVKMVNSGNHNEYAVWDLAAKPDPAMKKYERALGFAFTASSSPLLVESRKTGFYITNEDKRSEKKLADVGSRSRPAFSPDGKLLIFRGINDAAVFEVESGKKLYTIEGQAGVLQAVGFSPDRKRILAGSSEGAVRILDSADGHELVSWKMAGRMHMDSSLFFSPDGQHLLAEYIEGISIWSAFPSGIKQAQLEEEKLKQYRLWLEQKR